jgi:radical SAM protein with 4Fe4S-binding SPASM domain
MVISNTALLTDELAARLPQPTQVETTLFSADKQLHDRIAGPPGAFDRTINGIVAARVRGCSVAVSVVVLALNAHDVYRTIELALGLGAEAILLNRVNLTPRTLKDSPHVVPTLKQLQQALSAAEQVAAKYEIMVAVSVPIPPCLVEPADYPHLHFSFCPRGDDNAYYTISHNGLLRPCNHSSVILGDLRHERFADLICAARTREFWTPEPAECQRCTHPLAGACRGGCPAASDECYGSRTQIDPLVQHLRAQTARIAPCPAR